MHDSRDPARQRTLISLCLNIGHPKSETHNPNMASLLAVASAPHGHVGYLTILPLSKLHLNALFQPPLLCPRTIYDYRIHLRT